MSDVNPKFQLSGLGEENQPSSSGSNACFCLHSCYYRDFFLLRIPITLNGSSLSVIEEGKVAEEDQPSYPVLYDDELGLKLKISDFSALAAKKLILYGVYHIDTFYYEKVPLFLVVFQSRTKLKQFLEKIETVSAQLEEVLLKLTKSAQSLKKNEKESFQVKVKMDPKLFLVSPNHPTLGPENNVEAQEVTLANYLHYVSIWQQSKVFEFNHNLFESVMTEKPGFRCKSM